MADNAIDRNYDAVVEHLEDSADGVETHGAAVGVKQNDGPALRAALWALIGKPAGPNNTPPAVPGRKQLWDEAKANKVTTTAAWRVACSNGRALAMACVGALKPRLGNKWSTAWTNVGFDNHSLQVPSNPMLVLQGLRAYYARNPSHEVPDLTQQIACTAAACEAAAQLISTTQTSSNQSNADAGTAQANFEAALDAGRARLGGLREELSRLLADDDPLWYAFGFQRPCDPNRPDVPENLTATPGAAGSALLFLHWDRARNATSGYRVSVRLAADNTFVKEVLVQDTDAVITGVASGTAVMVAVAGRNEAGDSKECKPVRVTVP